MCLPDERMRSPAETAAEEDGDEPEQYGNDDDDANDLFDRLVHWDKRHEVEHDADDDKGNDEREKTCWNHGGPRQSEMQKITPTARVGVSGRATSMSQRRSFAGDLSTFCYSAKSNEEIGRLSFEGDASQSPANKSYHC